MKTVLTFAFLFVYLGLILIPYAGLEVDEVVFAAPLHGTAKYVFATHFLHHAIPLMVISYVGALKTWLYWPLLWIHSANAYAIRFPMVLAGAITTVIFHKWAGLLAGPRGALLAAVLLATDPMFLLTDTFDWGPVALQHLLVVSGCFLIARGRLSWGAFLFGLALWNKAIFVWTLTGLGLAALLVLPAALATVLADWRRCTRALLAFALGALPLLYFDVKHPHSTFGNNANFSVENFPLKYRELKAAVDGSGLFGFLVAPDSEENRREPQSSQGRAASWVSRHEKNLMPYAILIAACVILLRWRAPERRAALFAVVCGAGTFLAMAVTRDAGASVHHTVLVWPMPQLLVGAALGSLPWAWLRVGLVALLVGANLLVINQYIAHFERNGSYGTFTDATNPLAASLAGTPDENIYVIDWGIYETVDFLLQGHSRLREAYPLFLQPIPDPRQSREIDAMIVDPMRCLWTTFQLLKSSVEQARASKQLPIRKATRKCQFRPSPIATGALYFKSSTSRKLCPFPRPRRPMALQSSPTPKYQGPDLAARPSITSAHLMVQATFAALYRAMTSFIWSFTRSFSFLMRCSSTSSSGVT